MVTTRYVDYEGGSDGNDGLSYANRKKTITSATTGAAAGDTVRVMGSPAPTSLGQAATWTNLSPTVTLATAVTQMISDCETNWTASANVTCTSNTTNFKENTKSQQIAIAAGFTTGLAAYFPTGTLDLSGYQQVSFWLRCEATLAGAKNLSLQLCTDTVGAVSVHTVNLPDLTGAALTQWCPVTVDLAGNLNSAIKSVALYVDTDNGAVTILLDNICACKASASTGALSLTSLLGWSDSTGSGGAETETWYGIASINGTTVKLDNTTNTNAGAGRGWSGQVRAIQSSTNANPCVVTCASHGFITGDVIDIAGHYISGTSTASGINGSSLTVTKIDSNTFSVAVASNGVGADTGGCWVRSMSRTTWKRETIKTTMVAAAATLAQSAAASGSSGNLITISGGWDRTNMSSQALDSTWFDGQIGLGVGFSMVGTSYVSLAACGFVRYSTGITDNFTSSNNILSLHGLNNCTAGSGFGNSSFRYTITIAALNNNGVAGGAPAVSTVTIGMASNNVTSSTTGHLTVGIYTTMVVGSVNNNTGVGIGGSLQSVFRATGTVGNTTIGAMLLGTGRPGTVVTLSANNGQSGVGTFSSVATSSNASAKINTYGNVNRSLQVSSSSPIYLNNSHLAEAIKVGAFVAYNDVRVISKNDQGVSGAFCVYTDGGNIVTDTSTAHTTGTAWKFSPTNSTRDSWYPLELALARFTCVANRTYTVSVWTRRDSVTTLVSRLVAKGGQLAGVPSDVVAAAAGSANAWEQLSVSFTPTESGVIEITGQVYDGTGTTANAWFDDVVVNGLPISLDYLDPRFGPAAEPLSVGNRFY